MTIRFAMFDVDGTLKHEAAWLPGARELVAAVADAGVPVALCSGRSAEALYLLADDLPGVDFVSAAGGTVVQTRDCGGWRTLGERYLPSAIVPAIVADAAAAGLELWAYTPTRWVVPHLSREVVREMAATDTSPVVADLATQPGIVKFVAAPVSDADRAACYAFADRYPVGVVGSHPRLMDIAPLEAVAFKGGDTLVAHLGISWQEVVAVGDGTNDLGMLSAAGLACLMPPRLVTELAPGPGERYACADLVEVLGHVRGRLG